MAHEGRTDRTPYGCALRESSRASAHAKPDVLTSVPREPPHRRSRIARAPRRTPATLAAVRARELTFLAAAVALHLGLLGLARVAPQSAWLRSTSAEVRHVDAVEVELERPLLEPPTTPSDPGPDAPQPAKETRPAPPAARRPTERSTAPLEPSATPALTAEPAASATPAGPLPDEYGAPPGADPGVALAPGLGAPIWALPGILPAQAPPRPAPTVAPKAAAIERDKAGQLLRASMASKDHKLGLDLPGAGTIASAVADGVRASDAPAESRSAFIVRLDAGGRVVEVRAVRWSAGGPEAYHRAASIAASRLSGRAIAMPDAYAAGALVSVEITSLLTLPAGGSGPSRKGSSVSFDLSDVGAKPHRVIRSSYTVKAPG